MLTVRRTPRAHVGVPAALGSMESVAALVLAHVAAGGEVPAPGLLAAFGVVVYGAGVVVLRHKASIRVVLPVLLLAQVLGHAWLVALTPGAHAGHAHAETALLGLTPPMLAAHVAAAAVTGAMWALRRRAVDVLLHWSGSGTVVVSHRPQTGVRTQRKVPARLHLVATAPTRGPPPGRTAIA